MFLRAFLVVLFLIPSFSALSSRPSPALNNQAWLSQNRESVLEELEYLVWLFYRTQYEVFLYDRELEWRHEMWRRGNETAPMVTSYEYLRLMQLWEMQRDKRAEIQALYQKVIELKSSSEKDRAEEMEQGIWNWLLARTESTDRFALVDLVEALAHVPNNHRHSDAAKFQFSTPEALLQFLSDKEPKQALSRRRWLKRQAEEAYRKASPGFEDNLDERSEPDEDEIEDLMISDRFMPSKKRKALKVYPSTGSPGTFSGTTVAKGTWALTFDDGPSSTHTPAILNALAANNMKASFFWLMENAPANLASVNAAKAAGHMLGVHSYTHADLTSQATNLVKEVDQATKELGQLYGEKPSYFRCPYGSCIFSQRTKKKEVRQRIANLKMVHVLWNVDTLDWQDPDPNVVYERTLKEMKNQGGGIILFHDIHPQSVIAASRLMSDYLKPLGSKARVLTVEQIVAEINGGVGKF